MQKHTHTNFLLIIKKINEHEAQVVCARGKFFLKDLKKVEDDSRHFKVTQDNIFVSKRGNLRLSV